jgi:hypothetical protein
VQTTASSAVMAGFLWKVLFHISFPLFDFGFVRQRKQFSTNHGNKYLPDLILRALEQFFAFSRIWTVKTNK